MRAWSKAQGAWWQMMLALILMVSGAFGQTASSPNEGLVAVHGGGPGTMSVSWWGRSGRTYFVQTCETLKAGDWRYLPEMVTGADGVITRVLSSAGERLFVRLVYTDQSFSGPVGDADFDGDGLTNAEEITAGVWADPLRADGDGDGVSDPDELNLGSHPAVNDWTQNGAELGYDDAGRLTSAGNMGVSAAVFAPDSEGNVKTQP